MDSIHTLNKTLLVSLNSPLVGGLFTCALIFFPMNNIVSFTKCVTVDRTDTIYPPEDGYPVIVNLQWLSDNTVSYTLIGTGVYTDVHTYGEAHYILHTLLGDGWTY
jgi:hypothetical protein